MAKKSEVTGKETGTGRGPLSKVPHAVFIPRKGGFGEAISSWLPTLDRYDALQLSCAHSASTASTASTARAGRQPSIC